MWLSNNPILNVEDHQYIVDSITKLIQSVSSTNKERLKFDSKRIPKHNPVADSPLSNDLRFNVIHLSNSSLKSNLVLNLSPTLQLHKANYGRKKVKSVPKGTVLMDPGTFKLVIEH